MGNGASVDNSQKKKKRFQTSFSFESVFPPIFKVVSKGS